MKDSIYLKSNINEFIDSLSSDYEFFLKQNNNSNFSIFISFLLSTYKKYSTSTGITKNKEGYLQCFRFVETSTGLDVVKHIDKRTLEYRDNFNIIIDYIENNRTELIKEFDELCKVSNIEKKQYETHSDIFKKSGFVLFDYILNNYVRNRRGRKSDLNFYYRKLYNDDFIIESCRAENFKEWYEINYNDDFGQIKTLSEVENESRNQNYTTSLEWFKQSKL